MIHWAEMLPNYLIAQYVLTSAVILATIDPTSWVYGFSILDPIKIHKSLNTNWCMTILLCIVLNIVYAPQALIYWIYRLIRKASGR